MESEDERLPEIARKLIAKIKTPGYMERLNAARRWCAAFAFLGKQIERKKITQGMTPQKILGVINKDLYSAHLGTISIKDMEDILLIAKNIPGIWDIKGD